MDWDAILGKNRVLLILVRYNDVLHNQQWISDMGTVIMLQIQVKINYIL